MFYELLNERMMRRHCFNGAAGGAGCPRRCLDRHYCVRYIIDATNKLNRANTRSINNVDSFDCVLHLLGLFAVFALFMLTPPPSHIW